MGTNNAAQLVLPLPLPRTVERREKQRAEMSAAREAIARERFEQKDKVRRATRYELQRAEHAEAQEKRRKEQYEAQMEATGLLPIWFYAKDGTVQPQYREKAAELARERRRRQGLQVCD